MVSFSKQADRQMIDGHLAKKKNKGKILLEPDSNDFSSLWNPIPDLPNQPVSASVSCMCVHRYVHISLGIYVSLCVKMNVFPCIYLGIGMWVHVCSYMNLPVCVHLCIYTYIHNCVLCIYLCTYISVCTFFACMHKHV